MKTTTFLGLTLLNLGLVGYVCLRPAPVTQPAGEAVPSPTAATPASSSGSSRAASIIPKAVKAARPVAEATFHWRQVESEDYATYLANLRKIGCPEATIRDIIAADVRALYEAKCAAVPPARTAEFWRRAYEPAPLTAPAMGQFKQLAHEEQALLTHLLGGSWPLRDLEEATSSTTDEGLRLDGVLVGKRDALLAWQQQTEAQRTAILDRADGRELTRAEEAQLLAVDAASEAELSRLLTPAEREEYDLRNSGTATQLRERLVGFDLSESEFRSLFRLQQAHEQALEKAGAAQDADAMDAQLATHAAATRKLLGAEREAWFTFASNANFQALHQVGQQHALPLEQIGQAHLLHQAAADRLAELADRAELSKAQRQALARQALQAHDQQMKSALGAAAFQAYAQSTLREDLLENL